MLRLHLKHFKVKLSWKYKIIQIEINVARLVTLNRMNNLILSELASKDKNKGKILNVQYKKNHHFDYITSPRVVLVISY